MAEQQSFDWGAAAKEFGAEPYVAPKPTDWKSAAHEFGAKPFVPEASQPAKPVDWSSAVKEFGGSLVKAPQPVPGMELLGGVLPGPPQPRRPALPWETAVQQPTPGAERDIPTRFLDVATGGIGKIAQGIERTAGPLESFVVGKPGEPGMPRQSTLTPAQGKELAGGTADILGGTLAAATPLMAGSLAAAPLHTLVTVAAGTIANKGVKAGLDKLGVAPEYSDLASEIAGLLAGYATAAHGRLSPEQQTLIEILRGKDAPDASARSIEALKSMVDRGGTEHEQRIAQEVLQRKYGIKYGEPKAAAGPKPMSEMTDRELAAQANKIATEHPADVEEQQREIQAEVARRGAARKRKAEAAPANPTPSGHPNEPVFDQGPARAAEPTTPVEAPATPVAPAQPEVLPPVTQEVAAPVPQAAPTPTNVPSDPRLQAIGDADLIDALDHLNQGGADLEADQVRAELEQRIPGLNLRTVKFNGSGYFIEGDPSGETFQTESAAVRALAGIPEEPAAAPAAVAAVAAAPEPAQPQEMIAAPPAQIEAPPTSPASTTPEPPAALPTEKEVVQPNVKAAPETAGAKAAAKKETQKQAAAAARKDSAAKEMDLYTGGDLSKLTPEAYDAFLERVREHTHHHETNAYVLKGPRAPSGGPFISDEQGNLAIAKLVREGILTADLNHDGQYVELTINRDKIPPGEVKPEPNKFASTQVNLPEEIATKSKAFAATIPRESLIPGGIKEQPHITVRYGNDEADNTRIAAALAKEGPITAKIKGVSIFPNVETEHGKADVIKLDIDSQDLRRLNALIGKAVPHPGETFPEYKPHVTVAYVKPGEGKKYAGRLIPGLSGQTVTFNSVAFSPKSGEMTEIPLKPSKVPEKAAPPGPIPSGTWMNDGEIEQAMERHKGHPVLSRATKFLSDFQEEVNDHSDGWPYWKLPGHAAKPLMGMIQHPEYATEANFAKALSPIRAFYTRHGNAAGMKFPAIEGVTPAAAKKPVTPQVPTASQKAKAVVEHRREVYTPGNIVTGYGGGLDKVLAYNEQPNGVWRVQVRHVDSNGNPLAGDLPRWHATEPGRDTRVVVKAPVEAPTTQSVPSNGGAKPEVAETKPPVAETLPSRPETKPPVAETLPAKPETKPAKGATFGDVNAMFKEISRIEQWAAEHPNALATPDIQQRWSKLANAAFGLGLTPPVPPANGNGKIYTLVANKLRKDLFDLAQGEPEEAAPLDEELPLEHRVSAIYESGQSDAMEEGVTAKTARKRFERHVAEDNGEMFPFETKGGVQVRKPTEELWKSYLEGIKNGSEEIETKTPSSDEGTTIAAGEGNAATEPESRPESVRPEDRKPLEEQLSEGKPSAGEGGAVAPGGAKGGRVRKPRKRTGEESELEPSGGTVSGVVGNPAEPERTFPPRAQDVVSTHHDRDYRIPDGRVISGSPETRARNNIESIKVLRQIQAENRLATVEEQGILAGYVGWGAVPQLFAGRPEFLELQKELKSLLSDEEYDSAQRSTTNAHYTGDVYVDSIWSALQKMGAKPGMSWLEPAVGVGNFFGRQPQELLEGARRVGLDKDSISGQIAKLLYPDSGIDVVAYEDAELPKDYFDGAASNIPFGPFGVSDPAFRGKPFLTNPIHNYFFAKTLEHVRPGGVIAFVTSRYTMDGYEAGHVSLRKWISERAHFVGAIRLPSGAFSQNAGTEVITDIIFLRKKLPGEETMGPAWQAAPPKPFKSLQQYGGTYQIAVNEYYHANPTHILGEEGITRGQHTDHDYNVKGKATPEKIAAVVAEFPKIGFEKFTPEKKVRTVAVRDIGTPAERSKLGGLFFNDKGELFRKTSKGSAEGVQATGPTRARIRGQLAIRDALTKLTAAELADKPEAELEGLRKTLNRAYDAYVKQHGPLSSQSNAAVMKGDPDAPLLLSLERRFVKGNKSKGIEASVEKAPIFERRMLRPPQVPTSVDDPKEALYISLNEKGRLDFDRMSELTGKTTEELQKELAGLVYQDPSTKIWQTAEEYLSGSVRNKLKQAKAIAKIEPGYQGNVEALERVQPTDIPPGEIRALLGVTWVPIDRYSEFAGEMLGADNPSKVTVKYAGGNWIVANEGTRLGNAKKWATARVDAVNLLQDTLNMRRTKVYDRESDGKTTVNTAETKSARARQMEMQDHFEKWLFAESKRGDEVVRIYNDTQNDLRLRTYEGAHLTLPGMTRDAIVVRGGDLDPHQKAAVWRQIVQPNVLLAHAVGTGKTFEMIAGGMELQRLGLIRRPMYVVPNATLTSWQDQFAALYPQKRVLVFSEKDLERSKRQQMMAQIATGDWDAVVVPHSSFQFLATGDEIFEEHFQKLSAELEDSIREAGEAGLDTRQIKRMEKAKETLLTNLKNKRNADKKDQTVTWEQLGIDQLFVDESHEYKKLGFSTKQGSVAGIDQEGNQKTFDLLMKLRHTQKHGRGATFATGTPVTNTMGELYSVQRYLIEPELQARGIGKFDEWSANFGRTVDVFEPKIEGGGYQLKARFAQFVNLPELAQLFRSFTDVVTSDMVDIPRPELIGGKRIAVESHLTDAQSDYLENVLRPRALAIRSDPRRAMPDNMLSVYTDAQKMALDLRMVDPSAADDPNGRLNTAADLIRQYWEESAEIRGAQVVFSDLGKPAEAGGSKEFSVYDELIKKLVERGIPREEIAHIYQAKNKTQRARLFQDVNDGKIRVVLGSTMKLGVGVNMQKRLYAAHHLDVPHRPSDLEQREGRILRQGNLNPGVHVRYYVTKGSLDESKFANVVRKAKFINQVMQGKSEVREAEDVSGMVPSLEMFQAMASGDPRVMRKMEVDAEVDRLSGVYSGWKNQQYGIRNELAGIPGRIGYGRGQVRNVKEAISLRDKAGDKWSIDNPRPGKPAAKFSGDKISKDVNEALVRSLSEIVRVKPLDSVEIGEGFGLPLEARYAPSMEVVRLTIGGMEVATVSGKTFDDDVKRMDLHRRAKNVVEGLEERLANAEYLIEKANKEEKSLKDSIQEEWPYAQKFKEAVEEQQRLIKDLGGNKDDESAAAVGEGGEIADASVESAEQEPSDDEEAEGEGDEGEAETSPAKTARPKAPATPAARPSAEQMVYRGRDPVALALELRPTAQMKKASFKDQWGSNMGPVGGAFVTNGHMLIDSREITDAELKEKLQAREGAGASYADSTLQKHFDDSLAPATKPLTELGAAVVESSNPRLKGKEKETPVAYYADAEGNVVALDPDYVRLIKAATGATKVLGPADSEKAVAFVNDAGKPAAILMPLVKKHIPIPDVESAKGAMKRFLKEESGQSSMRESVRFIESKLSGLFKKKQEPTIPESVKPDWVKDIESALDGNEEALERVREQAEPKPAKREPVAAMAPQPRPVADSEEFPHQIKPSKLAQGIEAQAVENKLTEGFEGMPEYRTVNVKEQAKLAADLLRTDREKAIRIAMGQDVPPGDLLPESVLVAVENHATATGDVELLHDLATVSTMSMEATGIAQRLRMLAERNRNSPVTLIRQVSEAREAVAKKRYGPKAKEKIVKEIKESIKIQNRQKSDWVKFFEDIKCK